MKTEVRPTTIFLELSIGDLEAAIAVSLILFLFACGEWLLSRALGLRGTFALAFDFMTSRSLLVLSLWRICT